MPASFSSSARDVGTKISHHDFGHSLALAVAYTNPTVHGRSEGMSFLVVATATGEILAWDGVYFDHDKGEVPAFAARDLNDYSWDEWDDMPSKMLLATNGFWLNRLTDLIQPVYSIDRVAAHTLALWADDPHQDPVPPHDVVAYYPCTAENVVRELGVYYPSGVGEPGEHAGFAAMVLGLETPTRR